MEYSEYLETRERCAWLESQKKWHKNKSKKSAWHRNQANFYKRQVKKAWNLVDFSSIVQYTLRFHSKQIAENITLNNPFLQRMKKNGSGAV